MAVSRLTGRTLALATVALILACGKAVLGEPGRGGSVITGVGSSNARTAHSGSSSGSSGSRVATISGSRRATTGRGQSRPLITRAGSSQESQQASAASQRQQAAPGREPAPGSPPRRIVITDASFSSAPARARSAPNAAWGRLPQGSRGQYTAPRRISPAPTHASVSIDWAAEARTHARGDAKLLAALQTAPTPPPLPKNAFSLGASAIAEIAP